MKPKPTPRTFEVPLASGLEQKFDPRTAPESVAVTADNIVKVKKDVFQRRLGYTSLVKTASGGGGSFQHTLGLNLGSLSDRLLIFGSGSYIVGPQTIWTASEYSGDLGFTEPRGLLPDVMVGPKTPLAMVDGAAIEVDSCVVGDYLVVTWVTAPISSNNFQLYAKVVETKTGAVVQPDTLITTTPVSVCSIKCLSVGAYAVVVYADVGSGKIYGQRMQVTPGSVFTGEVLIFTPAHATAIDGNSRFVFEADNAVGDSTYFGMVVADVNAGGGSSTVNVLAVQASNLSTFAANAVFDGPLGSQLIDSLGIYLDATTLNRVYVTYGYVSGNYTARAASFTWPAIGSQSTAGTIFNAIPITSPHQPNKVPLVWLPAAGTQVFMAAISPTAAQFNAGLTQDPDPGPWPADGTYTDTWVPKTQFVEFTDASGTVTVIGGSAATTYGGVLAAKPYVGPSNAPYWLLWVPSKIQGTYYLTCADFWSANSDARPYPVRTVGTLAARQALNDPSTIGPGYTSTLPHLPLTDLPNSTRAAVLLTTPFGQKLSPTLFLVETNSREMFESVQHGRASAIAAGIPYWYDGSSCTELGFQYYPENVMITTLSNAGGTGMSFTNPTDTYSYIWTYEWYDDQGQWHLSARSPPIQVTGANVAAEVGALPQPHIQATFSVPSLGLTAKQAFSSVAGFGPQSMFGLTATPQACLYRTTLNGSVYLRVNDPNRTGTSSPPQAVFNTLSSGHLTYTDGANDTTIASNFQLYDDGSNGVTGNVDNFAPPATYVIVEHKRRIFLADGNKVWYSKQLTTGEAPAFNETSMLFTVGDNTPITAMCSLEDKLIIFKRERVWGVTGDGPADNGQGAFSDPQPIPSETGCNDNRSIQVTPEGVFFMSDAGLRLMTRSLDVQYAGWSVEDVLNTNPTITGSAQNPITNRTLFCANTIGLGVTLTGQLISRDYLFDAWTTASINAGNGAPANSGLIVAAGYGLSSRVVGVEPVLHLLDVNGTVWRENDPASAAPYLDNGNYYTWTWESAWLRPFGPLGRGKVWDTLVKLNSMDPHGLIVSLGYDDNNTYTDIYTWAWNGSGVNNIAPGGTLQTPLTVLRDYSGQKFETLRLKIQDVSDPSSVTGQGAKLLAITLNLGQYGGPVKLPSGATQ